MKNKPEEIDRNRVTENIGNLDKEIRMHAQGNPGPGLKGIKRLQRSVSSLALFSFSCGLVFMCIGVLGKLYVHQLHADALFPQPIDSESSKNPWVRWRKRHCLFQYVCDRCGSGNYTEVQEE